MARKKPRAPKLRIAGTYPIDSGTAVITADPGRDGAFTLEVNRVPSSYMVLGAPRVLGFDYMEWIATASRAHFSLIDDTPTTLTHLGGAGCSLARYCADVWPESTNVVVEIDRTLCDVAAAKFDLPPAPQVVFSIGDARAAVEDLPDSSTDVIIRDVFAGATTPQHVKTVEFFRAAARALTPHGIYLANIGDRAGLHETSAELAGMAEVFDNIGVISSPEMLSGREYGNVVAFGTFGDRATAAALTETLSREKNLAVRT